MKKNLSHLLQAHTLFVIIAVCFGSLFVYVTPPLWGPDESIHFFRSYQISQGKIFGEKVALEGVYKPGVRIPQSFDNLKQLVAVDISDATPGETKQVDNWHNYLRITGTPIKGEKTVSTTTGPSIYPAITYVAPAAAIAIAKPFHPSALSLIHSARLATLLLYALLGFCSIYILRKTAVKWIVFIVALLPMSIYQASIVSADSLVLGLTLIFFALVYRGYNTEHQMRKREIALITVTAILFTIVKPSYVVLAWSLFILPIKKSSVSPRLKLFMRAGIPIICTLTAIIFIFSARGFIAQPLPDTSLSGQLHSIVFHPFHYAYTLINSIALLDWVPQVVGLFGSTFVFIAPPIFQILLVALTLTTLIETKRVVDDKINRQRDKLSGAVYLGIGLLAVLAVVTTLYLTWTPIGANLVAGIQGRYFLPMLVFAMVGLRMLTKPRLLISEKGAVAGYSLLMSFSLLASLLWYYKILY
jgi:uncharacterized membrane protein